MSLGAMLGRNLAALAALPLLGLLISSANAGLQNFRNNSVGGVSISADGVLAQPVLEDQKKLLSELRKRMQRPTGDMNQAVDLRMVSLKGLDAAIADAVRNHGGVLPDAVKYLAGLQRIQYVFVYPEQNDVVIAGPAEGWRINDAGEVVGVTTGRPVLLLDDLLVAFGSVEAARNGGITCSIEPTQQGQNALNKLLSRQGAVGNPRALEAAMKRAFGPQLIKLGNIPKNSHAARVLVAADYRMKLFAMGLERSPVKSLPSYVSMLKNGTESAKGTNPRWWLACDYKPLRKSSDGLAWQLEGPGVKAMTENGFVDEAGIKGSGKRSPKAEQWARSFTENYDLLASKEVVFGQLRNVMDMTIIAAVIRREGLLEKAGCSLPNLTGDNGKALVANWNTPKTVQPHCTLTKLRKGWLVSASGGVQIDSWMIASKTATDVAVAERRTAAARKSNQWWWN